MMQSEQISELAAALAAAQGEMPVATRNAENPFYKSHYADLAEVVTASRPALASHGLSVSQVRDVDDAGNVILRTTLLHASGQWVAGRMILRPVKDDPQGWASATTYARRGDYAAIVGVVVSGDDDDAEGAVDHAAPAAPPSKPSTRPPTKQPPGNAPACPKCKADMKLRQGKDGQFWGCVTYPDCKGTRPGPQKKEREPAGDNDDEPAPADPAAALNRKAHALAAESWGKAGHLALRIHVAQESQGAVKRWNAADEALRNKVLAHLDTDDELDQRCKACQVANLAAECAQFRGGLEAAEAAVENATGGQSLFEQLYNLSQELAALEPSAEGEKDDG